MPGRQHHLDDEEHHAVQRREVPDGGDNADVELPAALVLGVHDGRRSRDWTPSQMPDGASTSREAHGPFAPADGVLVGAPQAFYARLELDDGPVEAQPEVCSCRRSD